MRAVGDVVVARPGTPWCSQDIGGQPLIIHEVHPYPDSVGGAVYIAHRPGTTPSSTADPHLQESMLEQPVKVYSAIVSNHRAARALGVTHHGGQIDAVAAATSHSDFVRRLAAVGLVDVNERAKNPYASATKWLTTYSGNTETGNEQDIAAAVAHPDQVLVRAMYGSGSASSDRHLPWPGKDVVLHPVVQPGKRTPEYIALRVEDVEGTGQYQVRVHASGDFLGTIEPQQSDAPRPSYIARFPDYDAAHRICADRKDALRELLAHAEHYAGGEPEEVPAP